MGRFRDWIRAEAASVLRSEFEAAREEMHRSLHDVSEGLQQQIARENEQTRRQILERQDDLADRTLNLLNALDQMRTTLDAHRTAQRAQLRALEEDLRKMMPALGPAAISRPTVVGGSIDPTAASDDATLEIDLTHRLGPGALVEARSRFDETWFDDLEIAEIVEETRGERYRLTRRRDGRLLPMLFDAADLRPAKGSSSRATRAEHRSPVANP